MHRDKTGLSAYGTIFAKKRKSVRCSRCRLVSGCAAPGVRRAEHDKGMVACATCRSWPAPFRKTLSGSGEHSQPRRAAHIPVAPALSQIVGNRRKLRPRIYSETHPESTESKGGLQWRRYSEVLPSEIDKTFLLRTNTFVMSVIAKIADVENGVNCQGKPVQLHRK